MISSRTTSSTSLPTDTTCMLCDEKPSKVPIYRFYATADLEGRKEEKREASHIR